MLKLLASNGIPFYVAQMMKKETGQPPRHWKHKIKWLGPGLTWMAAGAGGAGELLFPPRVGSLYGYTFLWALLCAVALKWFINREIGRFAVCNGFALLKGFQKVPGSRNWVLWCILIPQVLVAVASVAGIAGAAATAFILFLPGPSSLWTGFTLVSAVLLLTKGKYKNIKNIEKIAMVFAVILALVAVTTAVSVFPSPEKLIAGLKPRIPSDVDYLEIIPWLSFILAGAAGMTWYSYWLPAKGYGAAQWDNPDEINKDDSSTSNKLRGWVKEMTLDNSLGVFGGLLIVLAFLILGAELLAPKGLVPEEQKVASVLGTLLESTWGRTGYWLMIGGVLIGFWNTAMTNQDGWARLFTDGVGLIAGSKNKNNKWQNEHYVRPRVLWIVLAVLPISVYLIAGKPVVLLQMAGVIEAIHIPFVAALTLFLNVKKLPSPLRPSRFSITKRCQGSQPMSASTKNR